MQTSSLTFDGRGRRAIIQNCWVVRNVDEAVQHWLALGFGPFFRMDAEIQNARYRGRHAPLSLSTALGQAGDVQIELVQQNNDAPSVFREAFGAGGSGFHHVCRSFSAHFAAEVADFRSQGLVAAEGSVSGFEFCYLDMRSALGCYLEIVPDSAAMRAVYETVAGAARDWDGREPVRAFKL